MQQTLIRVLLSKKIIAVTVSWDKSQDAAGGQEALQCASKKQHFTEHSSIYNASEIR